MKKKYLYLFLVLINITYSCDSFLKKVDPNKPSKATFYTNENNLKEGVSSAYSALKLNGTWMSAMWKIGDMASDDTGPGDDRGYVAEEGYSVDNFIDINSATRFTDGCWSAHYNGIQRANIIISRAPESGINPDKIKVYVAECKALRAVYYFNLVRIFGDVPLVLEEVTSEDQVRNKIREPKSKVYDQIIKDLLDANASLSWNDNYDSPNLGRITKGMVLSYLCKVHLTMAELKGFTCGGNASNPEDYQKAKDYALEVINSGKYSLLPNYANLFKKDFYNSSESVFELMAKGGSKTPDYWIEVTVSQGSLWNDWFAPRFFDRTKPVDNRLFAFNGWGFNIPTNVPDLTRTADGGGNGLTIGTTIVELFSVADSVRRRASILDTYKYFVSESPEGGADNLSSYNIKKYMNPINNYVNIGNADDHYYVLRYADVLLMFAEAENEVSGPTGAAYNAINQVRNRCKMPNLSSGLSKDQFLDSVYLERRLELCFEGHRWFDLQRRPLRLEKAMHNHGKKGFQLCRNMYWPLNQRVIELSSGAYQQNFGY